MESGISILNNPVELSQSASVCFKHYVSAGAKVKPCVTLQNLRFTLKHVAKWS